MVQKTKYVPSNKYCEKKFRSVCLSVCLPKFHQTFRMDGKWPTWGGAKEKTIATESPLPSTDPAILMTFLKHQCKRSLSLDQCMKHIMACKPPKSSGRRRVQQVILMDLLVTGVKSGIGPIKTDRLTDLKILKKVRRLSGRGGSSKCSWWICGWLELNLVLFPTLFHYIYWLGHILLSRPS